MKSRIRLFLLSAAAVALCIAQTGAKSGIDRSAFDTACKPCDDFWRYANGGWLDKNPIPARQASWGTMSLVSEGNRERLRVILESAAQNNAAAVGSNERKIGDYYATH